MPILFSTDGQGVQVHEMQVRTFLEMGYRYQSPEVSLASTITTTPDESIAVKINTATLKELTERLNVSTAQSKNIREARPYQSIEDLINVFPDIEWLDFNLDFGE